MRSASAGRTPSSRSGSTARSRGVSTDTARALGDLLGHDFSDFRLLQQALTHRSYTNEHPDAADNDGLAFIGDAVLGLVVAEHLWATAPRDSVGVLTPRRAEIVSGASLARWAERIGLGGHLRRGEGGGMSGGRTRA